MGDLILKAPPEFEELPCRPPFRLVLFFESLFTQNVLHVFEHELGVLPGSFQELKAAEKERDERLPVFPDITIVALGGTYTKSGRTYVPVWRPASGAPIEFVRDYGAAWPADTRFILR